MLSKNTFTSGQAEELRQRLKEPRHFIQAVSGGRKVGNATMVSQVAERNQLPYHFASADEPTLRGDVRPLGLSQFSKGKLQRVVAECC